MPKDVPLLDPEKYPALAQLRQYAKLGGPMLIDRVYTEALALLKENKEQREQLAEVLL